MKVKELIEILEQFDGDMIVKIGMRQNYGSDFAMDIDCDIAEYKVRAFYGNDYKAVVITEGSQCGTVDYDDEEVQGHYDVVEMMDMNILEQEEVTEFIQMECILRF